MNCMIVDDDELSRRTLRHLVSLSEGLELEDTCNNAIEALSLLTTKKIDLLLLDIEMPGISGPQLLKSIHKPPLVIVISGKKEYKKLQMNVIDYLLKPVDPELFLKSIAKAQQLCDETKNEIQFSAPDYITIKQQDRLLKLPLPEILYFEAKDDSVLIQTANNAFDAMSTIDLLETKLNTQFFIRINKMCLINIQHISDTSESFVLINDRRISISNEYKQDFNKRLNLLK